MKTLEPLATVAILIALLPASAAATLLHRWTFDEASGQTVYGSGNVHGTMHGGVTRSSDTPLASGGKSLSFDGVNDYVQLGTALAFAPGASWTVSFWYKGDDTRGSSPWSPTTTQNLVGWAGDIYANVEMNFGVLGYAHYDSAWLRIDSGRNIADGSWRLITATNSGSRMNIYVDDQLVVANASSGISGGYGWLNFYFVEHFMMNYAGRTYTRGLLDDVRLYSSVLSAGEVQALYSAIPEPSALGVLLLTGAAGLARARRDKI